MTLITMETTEIRQEFVRKVVNKLFALRDDDDDLDKTFEHEEKMIDADESLSEGEKIEAIKQIKRAYEKNKIRTNGGTKRICKDCQKNCLATTYCEHCIRNYLKENFSNWTSGNNNIDNLIQQCQMETLKPNNIVEWIPYSNLQNIKYLTKGGCSEIYTANWVNGRYSEWDSKKQQLIREYPNSSQYVVLKRLENVESANRSWFDEVY